MLSFSGTIQELGCEKSLLDPALFIYNKGKEGSGEEEARDPIGLAVTHVDNVLHAGEKEFDDDVMIHLKKTFQFGSEENGEFRYVGLNIIQERGSIQIDQNHFVEAFENPDMEVCAKDDLNEVMDEEGQTEFRSVGGKMAHVGQISRPDLVFEAKALSSKYGKASKKDLKMRV